MNKIAKKWNWREHASKFARIAIDTMIYECKLEEAWNSIAPERQQDIMEGIHNLMVDSILQSVKTQQFGKD